jgi:hypothetical protein
MARVQTEVELMSKYLTPEDLEKRGAGRDRAFIAKIEYVQKEIVDGRPRLVVYFEKEPKGLLLDRQLYEDITAICGHNPLADEFFASPEGNLQ